MIDIERGGTKEEFRWSAAAPDHRIPGLAVFDSDATQAYVDAGNAIELLPFNIDIIQGLIEFCDSVKALFTAEARQVSDRLDKTRPQVADGTQAAAFVAKMSATMTAQEIADKVTLTAERKARLVSLRRNVLTPQERLRTVTVLAPLLEAAAPAVATAEAALSDERLELIRNAHFEAKRMAQVAKDLNSHLLEGHDLPVGSVLWRTMWEAARNYAQGEVHPGHAFPDIGDDSRCPLCQQILGDEARGRFVRLEDYVSAKVQKDAEDATITARMCAPPFRS